MTDADENTETTRSYRSLLGVGGALSFCCLVAAPAATGGAGVVTSGGVVAALGGGFVQVLVTVVTVGLLAGFLRFRTGGESCDV